MGLDMYIFREVPEIEPTAAGWEVWSKWNEGRELAYWRECSDLHSYIIRTFADGIDDCQRIPLDALAVQRTLNAIEACLLPHAGNTREQLARVRTLLVTDPSMKAYYEASW